MACGTRTLTIEVDSDRGPIRGVVVDESSARTRFDGWLELTAALEAARTKGAEGDEGDRHEDA